MALRDELEPKREKLQTLIDWVKTQPNADEWHEVLMDHSFSLRSLALLCIKHGAPNTTTQNTVHRYRERHAS
jgi:hypothetical protein